MRIGVEIGWSQKVGGARRVAFNSVQELCKLTDKHQFFSYSNSQIQSFQSLNISQTILSAPRFVPQSIWDQFIFPHYAVPGAVGEHKLDLVHFTNNIVPIRCKTPYVVTIHDMTPFVIPDTFKKLHGAYQRYYFKIAAKNARKIITVSENSKNDICKILGVNEDKVAVVPLAPMAVNSNNGTSSPAPTNMQEEKSPFILYVGAIHPRKNLARLLKAYSLLKKKKHIPHKLVVVGSQRWGNEELEEIMTKQNLTEEVVFTGRVSDEQLTTYYQQCSAFVYPSTYEGFGLPVIEAMAYGAPVVTSHGSSLEEVAGGAAELIDPYNEMDLARGIEKVIGDPNYAKFLKDKGLQRAGEFTWKKTAQGLLDVFESV